MNTETTQSSSTIPHLNSGLTSVEAQKRLQQYGENSIYKVKHLGPFVAFLKKFNSPLLLMLIGVSIVSIFLGQGANAIIILTMVLMSAILDYRNSSKSEQVAASLVAQVASTSVVWRDGVKKDILLREIVPGDLLDLSAGNVIPADCRVLTADDFFVNQSSLTGESFPVEKRVQDGTAGTEALADSAKISLTDDTVVFMGTSVVTGFATALVLRTGVLTEFGRIAEHLQASEPETSFERGIKDFSYYIMRLTLVMVTLVFFVNAYFGRPVIDSLLFAIAIAVGLTPELLPVIMSVALARGSLVMAKKEVIVKNLSAVQNFGSMNILCTDKTGTLTEDKISLVKCVDDSGADSSIALRYAYLSSVFHTARKNPLDEAIRIHGEMDVSSYAKIDEVPFDFHRRRDSIVADVGDARIMIAKGAPESILAVCVSVQVGDHVEALTQGEREKIRHQYDLLSDDGFRVLALATRNLPKEARVEYTREEEISMTFVGFAAFLDPAKQSSADAIRQLQELDIEVKIITGDSEVLTQRICRDLGILVTGTLTGIELDKLSDSQLQIKAKATNIFARVSPEQKERIVTALRKSGNTVGYMGDGINDAPVLKAADVGISVNNAVDVAKETADIILLTKSLGVLHDGVIEGRKTFQNTLKYIKMGFSSNFGNMFSMMGASVFLPFLPMLPAQILLNNFLYDMSQTSLPSDTTDEESTKKPLHWDMHYFTRYIAVFGLLSSVFDFFAFFMLYKIFSLGESGFQTGWFIESIATQVLIVYIIRTKRVPFFRSLPSTPVVLTTVGIVCLAWVLPHVPFVAKLLSFTPLPLPVLGGVLAIILVYLVCGEIVKAFFYRRYPLAQ